MRAHSEVLWVISSHAFWGDMIQLITLLLLHFLPQWMESHHLPIAEARNVGLSWAPLLYLSPHPVSQQACYFHSTSLWLSLLSLVAILPPLDYDSTLLIGLAVFMCISHCGQSDFSQTEYRAFHYLFRSFPVLIMAFRMKSTPFTLITQGQPLRI